MKTPEKNHMLIALIGLVLLLLAGWMYVEVAFSEGQNQLLIKRFGTFDGICPICKEQGLQSKVYPGGCWTTLAGCGNGYYDEKGVFHAPKPCNTTTCDYTCSNGHSFGNSHNSW